MAPNVPRLHAVAFRRPLQSDGPVLLTDPPDLRPLVAPCLGPTVSLWLPPPLPPCLIPTSYPFWNHPRPLPSSFRAAIQLHAARCAHSGVLGQFMGLLNEQLIANAKKRQGGLVVEQPGRRQSTSPAPSTPAGDGEKRRSSGMGPPRGGGSRGQTAFPGPRGLPGETANAKQQTAMPEFAEPNANLATSVTRLDNAVIIDAAESAEYSTVDDQPSHLDTDEPSPGKETLWRRAPSQGSRDASSVSTLRHGLPTSPTGSPPSVSSDLRDESDALGFGF